jgi:hypothetical protein
MSMGGESAAGGSKKDSGQRAGVGLVSSNLFGSEGADECQHFDPGKYKDAQEHLQALRLLEGRYAAFAARVSAMDAARQKVTLDAVKRLFCTE